MKAEAYRKLAALRGRNAPLPPPNGFAGPIWLSLLLSLFFGFASGIRAETPEKTQVLTVVTALFDGMREKDSSALEALFLPGARLGTMAAGDWVEKVAASAAYLDEVTFEETVLVDGDLAMAWTPYNLFVDNTFHHCGVDVFILRRVHAAWKILQLDDTRRKEGCDPLRRQ